MAGGLLTANDGFISGGAMPTARQQLVATLASADGWSAGSSQVPASYGSGRDDRSGFGHYHVHYAGNDNMIPPWSWSFHDIPAAVGTTTWDLGGDSRPETSTLAEFAGATVVVSMFPSSYQSVRADFTLQIIDACHGDAIVAEDLSFEPRKRIHLDSPRICSGGSCRCLQVRVTVLAADGLVTDAAGNGFVAADYFEGAPFTPYIPPVDPAPVP